MYRLSVEDKFAAAHQLTRYQGACENLHGHTWKMRLTIEGETLDDAGMLVDFHVLKGYLRSIHDQFDHKFLNDLLPFSPTSEHLARYIHEQITPKLKRGIRLVDVTVWESETSSATYYV